MFKIHSITGRLFIGIISGLIIGLIANILAPLLFDITMFNTFGFGVILLFIMMGFTIGFVGIFDTHPILKFKMHWWIRGIVGGSIFALILILLGYNTIEQIMGSDLMLKLGFSSPFWLLLDGAIIGLIISYLETKIAGEGSKLPLK